ncbi:tetratricopeptide repeat protein [Actinokineospora sp. 24-640]
MIQRRLGDRSREAQALDEAGETYRELGQPDEAAKFHRRAVTTHRDLGDRWRLGLSLVHLSLALAEIGETTESQRHAAEAREVLGDFDDPHAAELRARLG